MGDIGLIGERLAPLIAILIFYWIAKSSLSDEEEDMKVIKEKKLPLWINIIIFLFGLFCVYVYWIYFM